MILFLLITSTALCVFAWLFGILGVIAVKDDDRSWRFVLAAIACAIAGSLLGVLSWVLS